jgi:hypothetical protein
VHVVVYGSVRARSGSCEEGETMVERRVTAGPDREILKEEISRKGKTLEPISLAISKTDMARLFRKHLEGLWSKTKGCTLGQSAESISPGKGNDRNDKAFTGQSPTST